MTIEKISENKSFGGKHQQFSHFSDSLNCRMRFAIYLPPQAEQGQQVPVLYWLSGLTCTDENFMQKAGAMRVAAELGIAIVAPDTSPRGEEVADDPGYDLGQGAGFYLNATQAPWNKHYHMYDYVLHELPAVVEQHFAVSQKRAISGHSMGGHGALVLALGNSSRFSSVSAFSPICHPIDCAWGQKALSTYLGEDTADWRKYDASILLSQTRSTLPILVDQGEEDDFLSEQLKPQALQQAAEASGSEISLRMQPGYDHSYYFIASFIEQHLRFHHRYLTA